MGIRTVYIFIRLSMCETAFPAYPQRGWFSMADIARRPKQTPARSAGGHRTAKRWERVPPCVLDARLVNGKALPRGRRSPTVDRHHAASGGPLWPCRKRRTPEQRMRGAHASSPYAHTACAPFTWITFCLWTGGRQCLRAIPICSETSLAEPVFARFFLGQPCPLFCTINKLYLISLV